MKECSQYHREAVARGEGTSILCAHRDKETRLVYLSCPAAEASERQRMAAGGNIVYANYSRNELIAINYFITKSISFVLQAILIKVVDKNHLNCRHSKIMAKLQS